jgi:hypothetical protein
MESVIPEKLAELYGGEMHYCIHPDAPLMEVPRDYLRENIRSLKDPICNFCGQACLDVSGKDNRKLLAHVIGTNFIFCPIKEKALRTTNYHSAEICPVELGGCGGFASKSV